MRLTDVLTHDLVKTELAASDRDAAVRELVELLARRGRVSPGGVEETTSCILRREHLGSTAIGRGVAIPHGKTSSVTSFVAALGRSTKGVAFAAIDGEPVHLVFLLASPPESQRAHLKALAHISRLLSKQDLRARMLAAKDAAEMLDVIAEAET